MEELALHTLSDIPAGGCTIVRKLRGGRDFVSRMTALGFTEHAEVRVIRNHGHGPIIAMVRGARVALGRGEAQKVLVERLDNDRKASHFPLS